MARGPRARWLALSVLLAACSSSSPSLAVDLRSDFVPSVEVASAHAELTLAGVVLPFDTDLASADLASGARIALAERVPLGTARVAVTLLAPGGAVLAGAPWSRSGAPPSRPS